MKIYHNELVIEQEIATLQRQPVLDTSTFPWDVERAFSYVHTHLFDADLSVTRLQDACRLPNHNLSSRFRCWVGSTIRKYIEEKRMLASKCLLTYPDVPIYLIADSVGYTHHVSYTRAFQRCMGMSPSAYRAPFSDALHEASVARRRLRHAFGLSPNRTPGATPSAPLNTHAALVS